MHAPTAPPTPRGTDGSQHRPSLPGFADAIGERVLVFETSNSSWIERLRFAREFSDAPAFESALREQLDAVGAFRHVALGTMRGVERAGNDLVLISNVNAGRRLSEVL